MLAISYWNVNDSAPREAAAQIVTIFVDLCAGGDLAENVCYNEKRTHGKVQDLLYAIIALVLLAALAGWLVWRCVKLREAQARLQARCAALQKDRAIRQNLQHVLERREAEIRRLRSRMASFESDYHEMETRASDLNVSLFRESGLRILAEKEDGAKRMKMEQLEREVSDARRKLKEQQDEAAETVFLLHAALLRSSPPCSCPGCRSA